MKHLLSLSILALLAGCSTTQGWFSSPSEPATVRWTSIPNFESRSLHGKKFAIDYKHPAAAPEFNFIPDELIRIGEERGMVHTDASHEADFVVYASLRYFDASPAVDEAKTVLAADPKIEAGIAGWMAGDGGESEAPRSIAPIDPVTAGENPVRIPRTSNEWVVVLDLAVGERAVAAGVRDASTSASHFVRNEARLYGFVARKGLDRRVATEELRDGIKDNIGAVLPWGRSRRTDAANPTATPVPFEANDLRQP